MDFERQKPVTDEYRENHERVFGRSSHQDSTMVTLEPKGPISWSFRIPKGTFVIDGSRSHVQEETVLYSNKYPNGCPILSEEQGK